MTGNTIFNLVTRIFLIAMVVAAIYILFLTSR